MWDKLNTNQRHIVKVAAALAALMVLFPPIYTEAVITGLRSGDDVVGFEMRRFAGWGFIGQKDLTILAGKKTLKDPNEMSFSERWEFRTGQSLEELMAMPSPKVAYGVLGLQFSVLFLATAMALFFYQRRRTTGASNNEQA